MTRSHLAARWIGSMAAIAVGLAWLHRLGDGGLTTPPLSIDGAVSWLDHRDIATVAFAFVRLVTIAVGWYLLGTTAVGGTARYFRLARTTSVLDHLTPPFVRGMLGGVAFLGVMAAPAPLSPQTPQSPDAMVELPAEPPSTTVPTATLHLLPGAPTTPPSTTAPPTTAPPTTAPPTAPAPAPPRAPASPAPAPGDANTWVVQPGESFWSIATEHLADMTGRTSTEREIASYWRQVIEVNRSRLVNPRDIDLLFTGQEIELPAVAAG